MTGPISNAPPTAQDLELTEQLKATLHEHKMFDTEEGIEHRSAHWVGVVREVGVVRKDVGWHWNLIRESVVVEEGLHFWLHCWGIECSGLVCVCVRACVCVCVRACACVAPVLFISSGPPLFSLPPLLNLPSSFLPP